MLVIFLILSPDKWLRKILKRLHTFFFKVTHSLLEQRELTCICYHQCQQPKASTRLHNLVSGAASSSQPSSAHTPPQPQPPHQPPTQPASASAHASVPISSDSESTSKPLSVAARRVRFTQRAKRAHTIDGSDPGQVSALKQAFAQNSQQQQQQQQQSGHRASQAAAGAGAFSQFPKAPVPVDDSVRMFVLLYGAPTFIHLNPIGPPPPPLPVIHCIGRPFYQSIFSLFREILYLLVSLT